MVNFTGRTVYLEVMYAVFWKYLRSERVLDGGSLFASFGWMVCVEMGDEEGMGGEGL